MRFGAMDGERQGLVNREKLSGAYTIMTLGESIWFV